MAPIKDRLARASQHWRTWLLAFAAGAASVLAQPPFSLWPVLFVTLTSLTLQIDGTGIATAPRTVRRPLLRRAFGIGWWFGFGYFLFGLYWIGKAFLVEAGAYTVMMPFAMTAMPAGLALFYGLAIAIAARFWRRGASRLIVLALALSIAEWLRGHILTGFPWNALGYAFAGEAGLSQLSALLGPYALSLIAVLVFASPAALIAGPGPSRLAPTRLAPLATALLFLIAAAAWGHLRLADAPERFVAGINLRLVQPNVAQTDKWKPGNAGPIYRTMLALSGEKTAKAPNGITDHMLLIWPETALPFFMERSAEALDGIAKLLPPGSRLITGALRYKTVTNTDGSARNDVYNSLFVFDDNAKLLHLFDKKHLVPFGEYLPAQPWLEAIGLRQLTQLRGGFAVGDKPRYIALKNAPAFSPLICYEVVFPQEVVEQGPRPGWLLNVTNDAWYGISTGPYQHLAQARIRALETGLPMVRAANTGISAVIDPYGRTVAALPLGQKGVIDSPLPQALPPTLYARIGGFPFLILIVLGIVSVAVADRRQMP